VIFRGAVLNKLPLALASGQREQMSVGSSQVKIEISLPASANAGANLKNGELDLSLTKVELPRLHRLKLYLYPSDRGVYL
jgi:hypothetical protein